MKRTAIESPIVQKAADAVKQELAGFGITEQSYFMVFNDSYYNSVAAVSFLIGKDNKPIVNLQAAYDGQKPDMHSEWLSQDGIKKYSDMQEANPIDSSIYDKTISLRGVDGRMHQPTFEALGKALKARLNMLAIETIALELNMPINKGTSKTI